MAFVFYDDKAAASSVERAIVKFVGWLVQNCGLQEVATDCDSLIARTTGWRELYRRARDGIVVHRDFQQFDEEPYSPLARVTLLETNVLSRTIEKVWQLRRPHRPGLRLRHGQHPAAEPP